MNRPFPSDLRVPCGSEQLETAHYLSPVYTNPCGGVCPTPTHFFWHFLRLQWGHGSIFQKLQVPHQCLLLTFYLWFFRVPDILVQPLEWQQYKKFNLTFHYSHLSLIASLTNTLSVISVSCNKFTTVSWVCRGSTLWQYPSAALLHVGDLDYTRLMRQGFTNNPLIWQVNIDYIKSALYYATLGRAFRNCFSFQNISLFIHRYDDCENH